MTEPLEGPACELSWLPGDRGELLIDNDCVGVAYVEHDFIVEWLLSDGTVVVSFGPLDSGWFLYESIVRKLT
jgi:hypothetical protein